MSKKHKQTTAFNLEGRFLGFEIEDGYKIKRLNLLTANGEFCIKLSKEARASVKGVLTPGDWLWVFGEETTYLETGIVKHKAYLIKQVAPGQGATEPATQTPAIAEPPKAKPQATILYCQKSDCMKRGGNGVCKALQATLSDRELDGQVKLKGTGCMKNCKAGPNIVVMPEKARYSRISAKDVPEIIDKHFPQPVSEPTPTTEPAPVAAMSPELISSSV